MKRNNDTFNRIIIYAIRGLPWISSFVGKGHELHTDVKTKYLEWNHCKPGPHIKTEPSIILYVDPRKIQKAVVPAFYFRLDEDCRILSGDWDRRSQRYEDIFPYSAFKQRYINGVEWHDTDIIPFLEKIFGLNKSWGGCENIEEAEKRFKQLDQLFESIKEHGYKTQEELSKNNDIDPIGTPKWTSKDTLEKHEIAINIGRNGEYILDDGRHRLAIAKLLELPEIPVQVRVRHETWQSVREDHLNNDHQSTYSTHPDIKILKKEN